jgi:hypothetical protein
METINEAKAARRAAQAAPLTPEDEISRPTNGGADVVTTSFTKRLRTALEEMEDGQHRDIRTSAERQQVSNIVGQVQKKLGVKFQTVVLRKRDQDPEGKIAIRIKRIGPSNEVPL